MNERAETRPMRFGDDWAGVFFRGDNAFMSGNLVAMAAERFGDDPLTKQALLSLAKELRSCIEPCEAQQAKLVG